MSNIKKALWYELRRDLSVWILTIACAVIPFFIVFADGEFGDITGTVAAAGLSGFLPMIVFYYICFTVPQICWGDLKDKTMNYEVLGGHVRKKVFAARVLVTYELSMAAVVLPSMVIIALTSVCNGVGGNLTVMEMVSLYGRFFCVTTRLIAECILFTLLVGSSMNGRMLCPMLEAALAVPVFITNFLLEKEVGGYYSTTYRLLAVMELGNYRMGFYNGEDIVQYIITPDPLGWAMDSVGMLVVTAIILLVTYLILKKKDI